MIKFNLTSELKVLNGAKIEEIGNSLQNFTESYLYIDDYLNLNSVNNFSEMLYKKCKLNVIDHGFLLTEKSTNRLIHVFNEDLMNYLLNKEDEIENKDENKEEIKKEIQKLDFESIFSIKLKNSNIFINEKMFNELEIINDIDLRQTLDISFSSFLSNNGYIVKINIKFYEDNAEVIIHTDKLIDVKIIEQIEKNAVLEVNSDDLIFFKYTKRENVYSNNVSLDRLPSDLVELCMKNKKYVKNINEVHTFYYKNSEFKIKNEGYEFFSIFDLDLHFYLSHLHPNCYPNVFDYNELPIAQFYYKK